MSKVSRAAAAVWLCFLARGLFYSSVAMPLWEGFDEFSHYAYLQYVAEGRGLMPPRGALPSREVELSLQLAPNAWAHNGTGRDTHDTYWKLPEAERARRQAALRTIPPVHKQQPGATALHIQAHQPPLPYWVMAPVYWAARGLDLPNRVLVLRMCNVLLASLVIPAAVAAGALLFGSPWAGVALAAALTAMPGLIMDVSRVSNSGLLLALFSWLCVLLLRAVQSGAGDVAAWHARPLRLVLLGLCLGAGLLSKALFLAAVPAVLLAGSLAVRRRVLSPLRLGAGLALAAAISGWWYAANLLSTGTLSGQDQDAAIRGVSFGAKLARSLEIDWPHALDVTFFSHIWIGAWSFLSLRGWIYRVFALAALVALTGGVVATWRAWRGSPRAQFRLDHLAVLTTLYGAFWLALGYHTVVSSLANNVPASCGWYVYAVVLAEGLLAAAGWMALLPPRARPWIWPVGAVAFLGLEVYATAFVLLPYYTGITAHEAGGRLRTFHLQDLSRIGWGEFVTRLHANQPVWIGGMWIAVLTLGFCAAGVMLVWIAAGAGRRAAHT